MCALIQDGFPDQMFPQRRRLDALRGVCHHRSESARLRAWPISRHQSVVHPSGSTPSPGMLTLSVEKRQQPHCHFSYLCNTALRWNTTSKTYPGVSITHSIYSQDFHAILVLCSSTHNSCCNSRNRLPSENPKQIPTIPTTLYFAPLPTLSILVRGVRCYY